MKKSKAKLTALLIATSCCLGCAGVGVAALQQKDVVAKAATTEELTAEITNNGQFAFAVSSKTNKDYAIVDGSAAQSTLPEGYSGAVLEVYHSNATDGYDFITLDFSGKQIRASEVKNIVVRIWVDNFNSANDEFRTIGAVTGTQRQYGIGKYDLSTWCDVALTLDSIKDMTDENGYLTSIDLGIRDKTAASHLYIDSVTIENITYTDYNLGKLAVHQHSSGATSNAPKATALYMKIDSGMTIPFPDEKWETEFLFESGAGWKLNGNDVTVGDIESTNSGLYVSLKDANVQVGDVLSVEGTFYCPEDGVTARYIIAESKFVWNGTAWEDYVVYTTHELGAVKFQQAGDKSVYFKPVSGAVTTADDGNNGWTARYMWKDGVGVTVNDVKVSVGIKFPGSIFVDLDAAPAVNDVLKIGGTFYNKDTATQYVITETVFTWDGSAWVAEPTEEPEIPDVPEVTYETYTVTKVGATGDSNANTLYLYSLGGDDLPKEKHGSWDHAYTLVAGSGLTLNGAAVPGGDVKLPGDMFMQIGADASANDIITIDGTYVNEEKAVKLVFVNCQLQFDGEKWVEYVTEPDEPEVPDVPEIEYTTYTITKIGGWISGNQTFLYSAEGDALPKDKEDWENVYTLVAGSGNGITFNGETIDTTDIKQPGDLYIGLGRTPVAGDIFTIDGTYYNENTARKIVFVNCVAKFDGTTWVAYAEPTEVVVHNLGKLVVHRNSNGSSTNKPKATALYMAIANGSKLPYEDGNWDTEFTYESGAGWLLNGDNVTSFVKDLESSNAGLYVDLSGAGVEIGDILSIEGTFFSADVNAKYIIAESKFMWNGETWENYVEYATHEISGLKFHMIGNEGLYGYFLQANGDNLPIYTTENNLHWETEFACKNGVGIALNGETVKAVVKFPGDLFIALPRLPKAGEELTIGGTFYSEKLFTQYIITESKFQWDGATWIPVIDYTEYEIEEMSVVANQTSKSSLSITQANGESFAASNTFNFLAGTGVGITLNGLAIDVTKVNVSAKEMYIDLGVSVNDGDVVTIGGAFYNVDSAVKYIITDSSFIYSKGVWSVYTSDYNEIGVGKVSVVDDASTNKYIYLMPVDDSIGLPVNSWDDPFTCAYGLGVAINGEVVDVEILSIDNTIYLALKKGAETNDVLTIAGKFVSETQGTLYFVEESSFVWNGEAWDKHVKYTTVEVGKLGLYGNSATMTNAASNVLHLTSSTYTFTKQEFSLIYESGIGFTVNGEQREWLTFKNQKEAYIYMKIDAVNAGDVVKIGGTFVCPEMGLRYVIEESTFVWESEGFWNFECEKVNIGAVTFHSYQPGQDNALHVAPLNGGLFPVIDWEAPFVRISGNGITVNGQPINYENHVKSLGGSMFISIPNAPQEGDVLVIEGTLRSAKHAIDYVIEESILVYTNGAWVNQLYGERSAKREAVEAYFNSFTESDYYATEWNALQELLQAARENIEAAATKASVQAAYDNAIAEMNAVAKKADVDANFSQWVVDAKAELESYKNVNEYRDAEKAEIAEIIAKAKADIDACTSSTALNKIVKDAKAAMDGLFTDAEWTVAEDYAVLAKEILANYKSQADYKDAEWNAIQTIIANAYAQIDAVMANAADVDKAVSDAKSSMDKVKTAAQVNAEQAEVAAAKADLASYKSESDYNAPEWAEIQAILTKAYSDIDESVGDSATIANIVANAKVKMDKVLNSEAADAKAFADAKAKTESEIRAFVNKIDYSYYSDEGAAEVNGYIAAAMNKLANATTYADLEGIVDELKAQVESVEKIKKASKGCFGTVTGLTTGVTLVAAAALVLRKKKED